MTNTFWDNFRWVLGVGVVGLLLIMSSPSGVRAQLPSGTILGAVKDASGALVPDAKVTVTNTDTNEARSVTTSNEGEYRVPALPPGRYFVRIEKEGFRTETETSLTLDVAQQLVVNTTLQTGSATQEVTVTAEATLVNTTTSELGGLVNDAKIADLPLNGRNFVDLALLQPGVTNDTAYSNGGTLGLWFSVNGAPTRSNNTTMDGAPMTNIRGTTAGAIGTTLGVDGIKEYRVITDGFDAEYGLTMGSQIVIVSKGGTNQFHADIFEYFRNSGLDARNYFDPAQIPVLQRNNFGGSVGGPIKKDKTFFYGVYEGLRENLGVTTVDNVFPSNCYVVTSNPCAVIAGRNPTGTVAPVMRPILALYPQPNVAGTNQFVYAQNEPSHVDYGQMRVDHNFSASDSVFGRYTVQDSGVVAPDVYPQITTGTGGRDQFITLSENHIFSPALLNTARISYSRTNILVTNGAGTTFLSGPAYSFVTGQQMGAIQGGGIANFPGGNNTTGLLQNMYTLSDDVYYTKARHALKFGVLANRFENYDADTTNARGTLMFGSIAGFLNGNATSEGSVTPGSDENRETRFYTVGMYAQDDWQLKPRLTLNLGLRYEFTTVPFDRKGRNSAIVNLATDTTPVVGLVFRNPSYKSFSPRIGLAWDVFGNGRTSVRAAFGEYYDLANEGYSIFSAAQGTPPFSSQSSFVPAPTATLVLPFAYPAGSVGTSLHTQMYLLSQPHLLQWNLSIQQQLTSSTVFTISYVGTRGIHLWNGQEGNPCLPTSITNGIPFWAKDCGRGRMNAAFGSVNYETTNSDSWFNSLQALLSKRVSHGVEVQGSYTYGKVLDDFQGQQGAAECTTAGGANGEYPLNPILFDKGPACFDLRHNFRASVLYHLPNTKSGNGFVRRLADGWWTGSIVTWQTGLYFTPMLSSYRSFSDHLIGFGGTAETDRASLGTATVAPGQRGPDGSLNNTKVTFIPYDRNTVITGNPHQWFNPLMFTPGEVGSLGTAGRNMLEGPHTAQWDLSVNKDIAGLPHFGEDSKIVFRAEFFNILNHSNFALPNSTGNGGLIFSGATNDVGAYSESPLSAAGSIQSTIGTSRQIQLSLRFEF